MKDVILAPLPERPDQMASKPGGIRCDEDWRSRHRQPVRGSARQIDVAMAPAPAARKQRLDPGVRLRNVRPVVATARLQTGSRRAAVPIRGPFRPPYRGRKMTGSCQLSQGSPHRFVRSWEARQPRVVTK